MLKYFRLKYLSINQVNQINLVHVALLTHSMQSDSLCQLQQQFHSLDLEKSPDKGHPLNPPLSAPSNKPSYPSITSVLLHSLHPSPLWPFFPHFSLSFAPRLSFPEPHKIYIWIKNLYLARIKKLMYLVKSISLWIQWLKWNWKWRRKGWTNFPLDVWKWPFSAFNTILVKHFLRTPPMGEKCWPFLVNTLVFQWMCTPTTLCSTVFLGWTSHK